MKNMSIKNDGRTFGLIYEDRPEELWLESTDYKPVVGSTVRVNGADYNVEKIEDDSLWLEANNKRERERESVKVPLNADYKVKLQTPAYPVLQFIDSVQNAKDKRSQILIQGENLYTLKLLTFAYAGKVDCIYIDPPYNTGSTDWKYNNNFVHPTDVYRHSKWLSFIEHRLRIAKLLLNPANSCLIVAIDETERDELGLLLKQMFPESLIQMASVITGGGNDPSVGFNKSIEYLFFVMIGSSTPQKLPDGNKKTPWIPLQRSGNHSLRSDRPKEFYPVFISTEKPYCVVSVGSPLPEGIDPESANIVPPDGTEALWPSRHKKNGPYLRWYCSSEGLRDLLKKGLVKVKGHPGNFSVSIFSKPIFEKIESGELENHIVGYEEDGSIKIDPPYVATSHLPNLNWSSSDYYTAVGSKLVDTLTGKSKAFPYPKSLYAVEDAIRFFVANKPNALILDFFAGSGTTAHAVMRLNKQDGGRRVCVSVTNNENKICDEVTFPRLKACITGKYLDGSVIEGTYKGRDESSIKEGYEENLEYFKLCYADRENVELGKELPRILPLLWMSSGSKKLLTQEEIQECTKAPYMIFDSFGLITQYRFISEFLNHITNEMELIAISTFDDERYQWLASHFAKNCYQLPQAYVHSMEREDEI